MEKETLSWSVEELARRHATIDFPEYQREPSVWSTAQKRRLIDSMLRRFDIASLYVYAAEDGSLDCIDGRQRIGAIMAFLGRNPDDTDNEFGLRFVNEIYADEPLEFQALEGMNFPQIARRADEGDAVARTFIATFARYQLTVVRLSGSLRPEEFNLQFTRLNVGTIINSGEKLHAMVGDMREACFGTTGLGQHPFLERVRIPTRRYSREQIAAQILAQLFAREKNGSYTRTRHFDLQKFFKDFYRFGPGDAELVQAVRGLFDMLADAFAEFTVLRNRAITVSTVLLARALGVASAAEAAVLASFTAEFVYRLRWQIARGLDVDREYRYLVDFQRHVTQASVEKPAVDARARVLEAEYALWAASGYLSGDAEYRARTSDDPATVARAAVA